MAERASTGSHSLQSVAGDGRHEDAGGQGDLANMETYAQYARETCMASRQRLKLVTQELRARMRSSGRSPKGMLRDGLRQIGSHVGLAASRRLHRLADRIERKALSVRARSS
jgi:hypothetical protein